MKRVGSMLAALAVCLSGCVSPAVHPNPVAFQYKATNVVDWQEMARRTVSAIPRQPGAPVISVYVDSGEHDSRFYTIYQRYLQQELAAQNFAVLRNPRGADIFLRTDTDWVLHETSGKKISDYATLHATAIGLLGQFRHISSIDTGFGAAIGTGVIYDFLASLNGATKAEVVVTSSIITQRSDNLSFVRTEAIYVEPTELPYYMNSMANVGLRVTSASAN
jgi:hypothetical protein